ncbi:MAG: hypothetical protein QNJ11_14015 [Woeseiaceae bacterium]|nr:hypothetical protein [Woeseiaceae bacterium]
MKNGIEIRVEEGDALKYRVDVLALKYAQTFYGLDLAIARRFAEAELDIDALKPLPGKVVIANSHGHAMASKVLICGVAPLEDFRYQQIREFSRMVLSALEDTPDISHLGLTLHGAGFGLDEIEAFEAEIAGLMDAISEGRFPQSLQRITIIERNAIRAKRLSETLNELMPRGRISQDRGYADEQEEEHTGARLRGAGYSSDAKPHVFVAMPFDESMDDVYHYGISNAVRAAGFVCERADEKAFTGEVLAQVKRRIKSSTLVVADLSTANSNVYLEVGYAWGCDVPTVLVVDDLEALQFDVKGQRCLEYKKIQDLERGLRDELSQLRDGMGI